MLISQTKGYFENPYYCFLEEPMLFLNIHFRMLGQKPTQVFPWKLLKEADESRLSDICMTIGLKELNWLCKHMKNVRSSQPCILMNSVKYRFFGGHVFVSLEYCANVRIGKIACISGLFVCSVG